MERDLVKKIVEERQSKAEQERQQAEQSHNEWQQQEDFRFACERVSRFSPCESMDPEWDMWHDQPPSRGYWLNYAEAIIELVERGQAAGRDILPHMEHTDSAMRDVATDVYRLALDGKPEPVADLLEAIAQFDEVDRTNCQQWIKIGLPRLFREGITAATEDKDVEPDQATEKSSSPDEESFEWPEPRSGTTDARDLVFWKWYHDRDTETYHSPAKIRDKWNAENPENKISLDSQDKGIGVVKTGIKKWNLHRGKMKN